MAYLHLAEDMSNLLSAPIAKKTWVKIFRLKKPLMSKVETCPKETPLIGRCAAKLTLENV